MKLRNGLRCVWTHIYLFSLFQHTTQQNSQTLTNANDGATTNGVRLEVLSTNIYDNGNGWEVDVVNDNADDWGLWIQTQSASSWGLDPNSPSSFTLTLSGNTETSMADLIIAIGDGNDAKSFVISVGLNGQIFNQIAPGCDNIISPTQSLNTGDVYNTILHQSLLSEPRRCRPAYIDSTSACPYTTFGPNTTIAWPITLTLNNYPTAGYSTITFEANGYGPYSCGFGEAFETRKGLNVYITTLENDRFIISQIDLDYALIPTTSIPTESPISTTTTTTTQPTQSPSANPTQIPSVSPITSQPSMSPSEIPSTSPTNNPSVTPTQIPSVSPITVQPSISPSDQPSIYPTDYPSTDPPSVVPTISPSFNPTDNPTTSTPTYLPSITPTFNPSVSPSNYPTLEVLEPTITPSRNPSISPSNDPTLQPQLIQYCNQQCLRRSNQQNLH